MTSTISTNPHPMRTTATLRFSRFESPVGLLRLLSSAGRLVGLDLPNHQAAPLEDALEDRGEDPILALTATQLDEYFAGTRQTFDLPLALNGTPFQESVWTALAKIPFASTMSYRDLARRVGRPSAVRAVGAANGRNPIAIIIPCHRVIGTSGELVGYGGGLELKRWLLDHELRVTRGRYWIG